MSKVCQFSSLTSSIYWQKQLYTKKLKTTIFWSPYVQFPSNKNCIDQCTKSSKLSLFKDPKVSFYFLETSFRTSLLVLSLHSWLHKGTSKWCDRILNIPYLWGWLEMPIPALQSPYLGVETSDGNHLVRSVMPLERGGKGSQSWTQVQGK